MVRTVCIGLACLLFQASAFAADPLATAREAIGMVSVKNGDGSVSRGSCTAVGPNLILTAWHVATTNDERNVTITLQGKEFHPTSIVRGPCLDTSFLITPTRATLKSYAKCAPDAQYPPGSKVTAMGYAGVRPTWESISGKVESHMLYQRRGTKPDMRVEVIVVTQTFKPGMSGGGAFDAEGNLVGILLAIVPDDGNKGVILPLNQSSNLVKVK